MSSKTTNFVLYFWKVIALIAWSVVLYYFIDLEKKNCSCSNVWQSVYMKYYCIYVLIIWSLSWFIRNFNSKFSLINLLLLLISTCILASYLVIVKRCNCANNSNKEIVKTWNKIQILYIVSLLILFVHMYRI
jgi:hypothetical protein